MKVKWVKYLKVDNCGRKSDRSITATIHFHELQKYKDCIFTMKTKGLLENEIIQTSDHHFCVGKLYTTHK